MSPTAQRIANDAVFEKCVDRKQTSDRLVIACKLGLWSVDGPLGAVASVEREARHYWIQYFQDGEYAKILGASADEKTHETVMQPPATKD